MKVHYKKNLCGYSGTSDDAVYYYHPRLKLSLVRAYAKPKHNPSAEKTRTVMANLRLIQPSDGYKQDFKDYMRAYNELKEYQHKPMLCWSNLWLQMLYTLQKTDGRVNLITLSREQIYAQDLPYRSVSAAIGAGLLPEVDAYQRFGNEI